MFKQIKNSTLMKPVKTAYRKVKKNLEFTPNLKNRNLATTNSKVIVVSEKQVCGHLSFGKQNSIMKEYFLSHKDRFDIQL